MSVSLDVNGNTYAYPETNDVGWGPDATDWAVAVTNGMLQKAGGLFILLDDVDFGSSFGLISSYFTSRTSNAAASGAVRLANTDAIKWRNGANSADLSLTVSSDELYFEGAPVQNLISVSDTSTIDLTLSARDLSAAIVALSITDSLISASAAIAVSKLAALTASRAVVSDGSGFISAATTTATEIGYVNGVTSSIQTQLNAKQDSGNYITALTSDVTASGPGSVAATIANNVVSNAKLAQMPTLTIKGNNTGGTANALDLTVSQVNTMLGALSNPMDSEGDMIYGGVSGVATKLDAGSSGQYLKSNGAAAPSWATFTAPTVQKFTSGSGTYTTPAGVRYIRVTAVGGGGGGSGSSTSANNGGNGGSGGNTTFGTSLIQGSGGGAGISQASTGLGGAGGAAAATGLTAILAPGGAGIGYTLALTNGSFPGGGGGSSMLGGGGGSATNTTGSNGATNSGGGGGGGGSPTSGSNGTGGGAGGGVVAIITSPAATYSYAVGAAGTAGSAGTSGRAGGAGGEGVIIVEEFYT